MNSYDYLIQKQKLSLWSKFKKLFKKKSKYPFDVDDPPRISMSFKQTMRKLTENTNGIPQEVLECIAKESEKIEGGDHKTTMYDFYEREMYPSPKGCYIKTPITLKSSDKDTHLEAILNAPEEFEDDIKPSFSLRALGNIEKSNDNEKMVNVNLRSPILTYDWVLYPSHLLHKNIKWYVRLWDWVKGLRYLPTKIEYKINSLYVNSIFYKEKENDYND